MEFTLHRQLKELYATDDGASCEERLGPYRIDVRRTGELVEIQLSSLGALRRKIARLLDEHQVLVVKPLVAVKQIVKHDRAGGRVIQRRLSPKRQSLWNLFDELVHFTGVFPHANLVLEVPILEIEEWRFPGHGRRRRWRAADHQVQDQRLVAIQAVHRFRTARDLAALVPVELPQPFHTGQLAQSLGVSRNAAQRITYCLRHCGAAKVMGKSGNSLLYKLTPRRRRRAA